MLNRMFLPAVALGLLLQVITIATGAEQTYVQWLEELEKLPPQMGGSEAAPEAAGLLNVMNAGISTNLDIQAVRNWSDDDRLVDVLIPFAGGAFPETRIPATLILGNVVDNTNVCRVLVYIDADKNLTADGRYNLLQVVRQVSYYAFSDTGDWIEQFVGRWQAIASADPNLAKTSALLTQIQQILTNRTLGRGDRLAALADSKFKACVTLMQLDKAAQAVTATAADNGVVLPEPLDVAAMRDGLFSPERQGFVNALVTRYVAATLDEKAALRTLLLDTLIDNSSDNGRRYRVNLYVALAFSRLPAKELDSAGLERLGALRRAEEMSDATFSQNVNAALRKQGGPDY